MSQGGTSTANFPPLQAQDACKVCGFRGKNLIQHYVENHPGVEAPVQLTQRELYCLRTNSKKPQSGNSAANHDKENLLMEFLNKLGPEATFRLPVECPLCPYSTTSRSDMMNHLLIHQSTHFVCYFCSANETNLNDFRDHVSTHTGEYAYQCIHCTFRGAHSNDVARHITTSHPGKEAKTIFENVAQADEDTLKGYACSYCGYTQMSKATMEKHVASVDTFCRGSSVIEFDLSRGRSSTRSTVVKSNAQSDSAQHSAEGQNRVYIQDEIEIEPNEPAPSDSILPYNNEQNREGWNPVLKIKTEKVDDGYNRQSVNRGSPVPGSVNRSNSPTVAHTPIQPKPILPTQTNNSKNSEPDAPREPRPFVCASCQFSTKDEAEFIKHARTDHRTDLSLWCKSCGKCFSNAGVLVTHIKEGTCEKEEMVYRCGVKECTFETPSGQTFVHHLRHCHKGSPFIFCVHCQKIFTLPHCLILHMQNDCPYKERNRKNPGQTSSETPASTNSNNFADKVTVPKPVTPIVQTVTPAKPILPRTPASGITPGTVTSGRGKSDSRGRGSRGRGRGRGRPKFVDSESESDPDDPSWTPEEIPSSKPVRRSARFRRGEDPSESTSQNGSKIKVEHKMEPSLSSQPRTEEFLSHAVTCPCCDFSTLSKTLLEDHYVSEHKKTDKNQCKVCSVKFETITAFTEHFETLHRKEIVSAEKNTTAKSAQISSENVPAPPAVAETDIVTNLNSSVADNFSAPGSSDSVVKIPYQTAIHEKNQKDAKLKNFEELKAPNDIVKMKEELKLKHFFKCMLWNCTFTTDNSSFFISHMSDNHSGKKLYCSFCFKEYAYAAPLTNHMLSIHSKRCYQCSACFYRAFSKPHVQIHIKYNHSKETAVVYTSTTHLTNAIPPSDEKEEDIGQTTWPYHCAIGECKFKTFDPKDFKKHNEITHRAVSVFICYYCKAEFISFKRLMNHYRLHGINNYQCTYCLHGSDTKDEILAHLSQNHADKPFQIHMRAPQEGPFGKDKTPKVDSPKASAADTNNNQSSIKADIPVDRPQKKYGKPDKAADSSEAVPMAPPVPVEKIKKESESKPTWSFIDKCVYEKVYPHHITDFKSRFSCGVPTCEKQFDDMDTYLKHLRCNHVAMNNICPYCLEVSESELDFKDHLWYHGPNLFACSDKNCCYSHWKKEEVVEHMKAQHGGKGDSVITVRHKELDEAFVMELPDISCPEEKKDLDNLQVGFLCPFCYYKSKSRVTMKKHIYKEFEYMRFRCTHCDSKFCSQNDIQAHFAYEHANEDIKALLDLNAEIEHKVKAFLFCHQNASTQLKDSRVANTKVDVTLFCADCNKKFPRARDWHEHLKLCLIHQYDAKVLECVKCLVCSATFSELNLLKIHFSSVHCGKQLCFTEKPNRMEWMRETLLTLRLQYVEHAVDGLIKLCSGNVLDDLLAWTSQCKLESKTYKCFYCSFSSPFKFSVAAHLASSHSGKPIKIDRLTSRLLSFPGPKSAEGKESGKTEAAAYGCILCLKKFTSIDELQGHLSSCHSEYQTVQNYYFCAPSSEPPLMDDKKTLYECLYCSSGRITFSEMKLHYKKYHPVSDFKMKGFLDSSKRKLGEAASSNQPSKKIRKDNELLNCWHCLKSFSSPDEHRVHCHIIHPGLPVKYEIQPASDDKVDHPPSAGICVSLSALGEKKDIRETLPSSSKGFKLSKFSCTYCASLFNSSYQVERHVESQHAQMHRKNQAHNLDRVTVCLEHQDLGTIRLSAMYFSQTCNISPNVEVTDILKK